MKFIETDRWPGGFFRAAVFSYDDGRIEDIPLVALFNKYSLKATFHLCTPAFYGCFDFLKDAEFVPVEQIPELYAGHEVSCHMEHHPFPCKLPDQAVKAEITRNRLHLEELVGYPVRGMSYPFGQYNDRIIKGCREAGMEYARTAAETGEFYVPDDLMKWDATTHHARADEALISRFAEPDHFPHRKLLNIWGHSYELNSDAAWSHMEQVCKNVSSLGDTWFATYIEIADYLEASRNLKFSAECGSVYNPSATDVWISVDREPVMVPAGKTIRL